MDLARYDFYKSTHVCEKCGKTFEAHAPNAKYCDTCSLKGYASSALKKEKYVATEVRTSLGHKLEEAKERGLSYGKYMAMMRFGMKFGGETKGIPEKAQKA